MVRTLRDTRRLSEAPEWLEESFKAIYDEEREMEWKEMGRLSEGGDRGDRGCLRRERKGRDEMGCKLIKGMTEEEN